MKNIFSNTKHINDDQDLIAMVSLNKVIDAYLPWSDSAIKPAVLQKIINDIILNNRKTIVECGSGISTLYIAKILKLKSIKDGKIYSIDHDKKWIEILQGYIQELDISSYVKLIHAPLKPFTSDFKNVDWYDQDVLTEEIKSKKIDQLIVDGPPAYKKEIEFSRYPAVTYFKNKLSNSFSVFLDDTDRKAEYEIIKKWADELKSNIKYCKKDKCAAMIMKGDHYNI